MTNTLFYYTLYIYLFLFLFIGDDQAGYNIPEIRACPQVGDFLSQAEDELVCADPSQAGEPVRRLLCDSYMCLYQSESMALHR